MDDIEQWVTGELRALAQSYGWPAPSQPSDLAGTETSASQVLQAQTM